MITWDAEFRERRYEQRRELIAWSAQQGVGPHLTSDFDDDGDSDPGYVGETGEQLLAGGGYQVESKQRVLRIIQPRY